MRAGSRSTSLRVGRRLGRPRTRPDRVVADKAYSSRDPRHLRARGIGSVIPNPMTRRPTASAAYRGALVLAAALIWLAD
jgi:hypothetical protein